MYELAALGAALCWAFTGVLSTAPANAVGPFAFGLYRQGAVSNPEDVAAGFRRIEDEAKRMSLMVEDLLLLSRLETEQRAAAVGADTGRRAALGDVDLTVLAFDAVSDAEARAETTHRLRVRGYAGPLGPTVVRGDEQRLRQVVTNLVTNAQRYTPEGSDIDVLVGAEGGGGGDVVLQVVDHGPGIPEAQRERIFERFFRANAARNRASGSTGLGLSIVAAIVAAHHGSVQVDETPGGGATFTVRLPAGTAVSQGAHSTTTDAGKRTTLD